MSNNFVTVASWQYWIRTAWHLCNLVPFTSIDLSQQTNETIPLAFAEVLLQRPGPGRVAQNAAEPKDLHQLNSHNITYVIVGTLRFGSTAQ